MNIFNFIRFCFILVNVVSERIISDEKDNRENDRSRKYAADGNPDYRRFLEDMEDEDWHVSHLKDLHFDNRRSDCVDETLEDRIRKYRKALQRDGALVEFVSSDPLPFNSTDTFPDTCKGRNVTVMTAKSLNTKKQEIRPNLKAQTNLNLENSSFFKSNKEREIIDKEKNKSGTIDKITNQPNTATTVSAKKTVKYDGKVETGAVGDKNRRVSEYVFSSMEYYDEVGDFDEALCPNAVEVINLEIDELRNYDVECEKILEWRSLD